MAAKKTGKLRGLVIGSYLRDGAFNLQQLKGRMQRSKPVLGMRKEKYLSFKGIKPRAQTVNFKKERDRELKYYKPRQVY